MTITKEGSLASFYTVNKALIKHLRVYFSPKLAGSGDPSPENVRPIEGWTQLQVMHCKKNIFQNANGNKSLLNLKAGIPITISYKADSSAYFLGKDKNNNNITSLNWINTGKINNRSYKTITPSIDIPYGIVYRSDGVQDVMIEYSTKMSSYEKYNGTNLTVDWSNDIGTIYGGYVDLITGEVWKTYDIAHLNDPDKWVDNQDLTSTYKYNERFLRKIIQNDSYSYTLCTILPVAYLPNEAYGRWNGWNDLRFLLAGKSYSTYTLELVKTFASENKITISYLLNTPLLITTLTPIQLQTFIGQNNIWSNADRVEVEYDLAESNDELYRRRNIILLSAPHLESVSGNIANFNTDLAAPIKNAKIYFNPILEGSGESSPENIREIVGWNGFNLKLNGKNLIKPYYVNRNIESNLEFTITGADYGSWENESRPTYTLPPGTYTFSRSNGYGRWYYTIEPNINTQLTLLDNNQISRTLTFNTTTILRFKYGNVANEYPFTAKIQCEIGNNATNIEAYNELIIPITFPVVGKNLLDPNCDMLKASAYTISGDIITQTGSDGRGWTNNLITPIYLDAGTYALSCSDGLTLNVTNSLDSYETITRLANGGGTITLNLACYVKIKHTSSAYPTSFTLLIERGSSITAYEPYTTTVYGGYVDLINGEIVETYKKYNVQNLEAITYGASSYDGTLGTNVMYYLSRRTNTGVGYPDGPIPYGDKITVSPKNISGYYTGTWSNPNDHIWQFCINASNLLHVVFDNATVGITLDMTFAQRRATITAWILNNPIFIVVPLETPIHHPLTPQTLKTLKGVNNIWSDANGPITVQYWTH